MTRILILDGGLGTSLEQKYGVKFGASTPLWSGDLVVSDPQTLLACQSDFGRVPVDILLTATYQVSMTGLNATRGVDSGDVAPFLERAVRIAEQATRRRGDGDGDGAGARAGDGTGAVALSLGPYGACMTPSQEYSGRYDGPHDSHDALLAWHRDRLALFARGVDGLASRAAYLAMETIPRVDEIAAMRRALDAVPALAAVPFWMSCLFPGEADDNALPSGETARDALRAMLDPAVAACLPWGVGINCTKVRKLPALLRTYEDAVRDLVNEGLVRKWPALVLYPDGTNGEVYNTVTQTWEMPNRSSAAGAAAATRPWEEQLADAVRGTQSRGEWHTIVVGGCCMASADDIARLRTVLL